MRVLILIANLSFSIPLYLHCWISNNHSNYQLSHSKCDWKICFLLIILLLARKPIHHPLLINSNPWKWWLICAPLDTSHAIPSWLDLIDAQFPLKTASLLPPPWRWSLLTHWWLLCFNLWLCPWMPMTRVCSSRSMPPLNFLFENAFTYKLMIRIVGGRFQGFNVSMQFIMRWYGTS